MDNNIQIAWAAGLFEGEGCISAGKNTRKYGGTIFYGNLSMGMTDKDVVDRFHKIVGVGTVYLRPVKNHKTLWVWSVGSKSDFDHVMKLFHPYLGERRLQKLIEVEEKIGGILYGPPKPQHKIVYDEATRAKMSAAWTPERKAKLIERNKQRKKNG